MALLIPFKKFIGCEDCEEQWTPYCPLCKQKGRRLKTLDAKAKKMDHYKFWRKEGEIYYYYKVKNFPPKKQNGVKITKKNKVKIETERQYWSKFHSRRVVSLILKGHDAACRCCYTLENLTFDHVIPLVEKGRNVMANGQILCYDCNQTKGDRLISIEKLQNEIESEKPYESCTI